MLSSIVFRLKQAPRISLVMMLIVLPLALLATGCGDDEESIDAAVDKILEEADASFNADYEIKVTDMVVPYTHPTDDLYGPQTGNKWVKTTISVTNNGDPEGYHPVVASFMDFEIEASDGQKYGAVLPTIENEFGSSRSPEAGQTETGDIVFEIPEGADPVVMWETVGGDPREVELSAAGS